MDGPGRCSFLFFKYALIFLNVFYLVRTGLLMVQLTRQQTNLQNIFFFLICFCSLQIVGIALIAVAAASKASAMFTSLSVVGGIVACGVFLVLVAIFGLLGAVKHHQVVLFFVSSRHVKTPVTSDSVEGIFLTFLSHNTPSAVSEKKKACGSA